MYLVKEGFDVRIAGDGGRAVEEFQKQAPDLILLDIMLPVMDGWAVCAKIRETSKVPIIMVRRISGWACPKIHFSSETPAPLRRWAERTAG